ncbi:MAG: FtsX-like permease family protein [Bacteroidetes bacterium]|nr:FtsX-like permease family protein [Bacteroidota bacterium]
MLLAALNALDRKVLRNLWEMRGQVIAIALVMLSGVATFVMALSTIDSLEQTRERYYQDYRFAEVFAPLVRAPERVAEQIREIPGVSQVQTRVTALVNLSVPGYTEPVSGQLLSIPDDGRPALNQLYLEEGRRLTPGRDDEVILSDIFAEAQDLQPGDSISAVINGRRKQLTVVGVALSPEYIFQIKPGALLPAPERFGILWMGRTPLGTAQDMEGAFNNVTLTLAPGADEDAVIDRLDALLAPYGGQSAHGRDLQPSHNYLSEELRQLRGTATVIPTIFLAVAAFLLNIVISRLINTQRTQIAAMKAFGYSNVAVGVHYLKLVLVIVVIGSIVGSVVGVWMGIELGELYLTFYRFPYLDYVLEPSVLAIALLVSAGAALAGTLYAIRKAVTLPPAVAMRPAPPALYRETLVERLGLKRWFSQPTRMIVRQLQRRPTKALLTVVGVAAASAILVLGQFSGDSIDYMLQIQFDRAQREDLTVSFTDPASAQALYEVQGLRGVTYGEPFRSVPVRLRNGHRTHRTAIQGLPSEARLHRILDENQEPITIPPEGMLLTDYLAELLDVQPGDELTAEVLEGRRPERTVAVAGLVKEYTGVSAYMTVDGVNRLMQEGHLISGLYLAADARYRQEILQSLQERPRVADVTAQEDAVASFIESWAETILTFTFIITLLAGIIAFGVVYNSARISLSERSRELASLRVLGFTRGEISYILLGELAILTLIAVPLGLVAGWLGSAGVAEAMATEMFRIPVVIDRSTFALAALAVLVAAAISGLIVRRRLDHLDLIDVLKTRE